MAPGLACALWAIKFSENFPRTHQEDDVVHIVRRLGNPTCGGGERYPDLSTHDTSKILDQLVEVGILQVDSHTRKQTKRYRLSEHRQETT